MKKKPGKTVIRIRKGLPVFIRSIFKIIKVILKKFIKDQCLIRAAGLSFTFLLALVPLLALVLSLFSGFGIFDTVILQIQTFVAETLLPAWLENLLDFIDQFTTNTRALGIFGLTIFLFTSAFFLLNVENNFNAMWGTKTNKKFVSRFTSNTSVLVFGTLLLGASFSLSNITNSILNFLNPGRVTVINNFFVGLFSFFFMALALLLLIMIIPATRVQLRSALLGALIGAALWEIAKRLFGFWTSQSIQYSVIYGTFALIPIFLIWIYIGWIIALVALEITCVHQYRENPWVGGDWPNESCSLKMLVGFQIFIHIARKFRKGQLPLKLFNIARDFSMNYNDVKIIGEILEKGGLLLPFDPGNGQLIPARDLSSIKLNDVAECLFGSLPARIRGKDWEPVLKTMQDFRGKAFTSLKETTVLDYLNKNYPDEV